MTLSNAYIQRLMESEQHDLVSTVINADRIVDIVKEQKKTVEEKLKSAESETWSANNAKNNARKELDEYKAAVSAVIVKIQTILDVKYPDNNHHVYSPAFPSPEAGPIAKLKQPEEMRILKMLKTDLDNIDKPF